MALYEVKVLTTMECYYLVSADSPDEASQTWNKGTENGEFILSESVEGVNAYDNRFDDDESDVED